MLGKAAASAADHVFLDLEDSVAPNAKVDARNNIVTALTEHDWGTKVRCVRVNALDTAWCHEDIIHVVEGAGQHLDTIMIPKARSAADVQFYATLLQQLELKCGLTQTIGIEVLIEEVEGCKTSRRSPARVARRIAHLRGCRFFRVHGGGHLGD